MTLYAKSFCEEAQINLHILGEERTFTILNDSGVQKLCNEGDYDWEISLSLNHMAGKVVGGGGLRMKKLNVLIILH